MAHGSVIWFYGADAVGKSVVGWQAYGQLVERGLPASYVDTDHLGFCSTRPDDPAELVAANLAALWARFAEQGSRYLVVSGILVTPEHRRLFAGALPGCALTTVLLRARASTIRARVLRRRQVEAAEQQTSLGADVLTELAAYGDRSVRFAELLDAGDVADLVLPTDDATPAEVAARALEHVLPSTSAPVGAPPARADVPAAGSPPRPGRPVEDVVVDAEFIETEDRVDLVSLALVGDGGREFYAVSADHDASRANAFVRRHVLPQLEPPDHPAWLGRPALRQALLDFLGPSVPRFWSWGGAPYDWLVLAQLFPLADRVPEGWRHTCYDLTQLAEQLGYRVEPPDDRLPPQPADVHHALADARWAHRVLGALAAHRS